jgi:hypothetical protein
MRAHVVVEAVLPRIGQAHRSLEALPARIAGDRRALTTILGTPRRENDDEQDQTHMHVASFQGQGGDVDDAVAVRPPMIQVNAVPSNGTSKAPLPISENSPARNVVG